MTTIYSSWMQGYEHAPDQVKTCLDRWSKLNPTYSFELLEWSEAEELLADFPSDIKEISPQSLSDILRITLLQKTGGVWVDATVFPTRPLSEWLPDTVGDADFFSYRREIQHEHPSDRPISAWFLYAKEASLIVQKLWEETVRYWSIEHHPMTGFEKERYHTDPVGFMGLLQERPNAPYPYHWFQHIFAHLIKNDPEFAQTWDACPYRSMTNAHQIQYWAREELIDKNATKYLTEERIKNIIENSEMQKLNWRLEFPIETMEKYSVKIPNDLHNESFGPKFL